ncbi:coiled-coil domain-containing protein 180 [Nyctibius grandis]
MQPLGAVRLVPHEQVYRPIFEDEVRLRRSLDQVRNKIRLSRKSQRLALGRDSEIPADARLLPCYQQKQVERAAYSDSPEKPPSYREATTLQKAWTSVDVDAAEEVRSLPDFVVPGETRSDILELLSECRRRRHEETLASMHHELACIAREMEPFVLEPGKLLQTKLMESDRKIELLFKKIETDTTLEGFSMEDLEELWNIIHQESLTRRMWIREMDESLKKVEWSRADKITDVLRKYTMMLEEISFLLSADVHRLINDEAMLINRELLANQRAIAKLFFNLMKSEMKTELSHRLKWQDRVKDWNHIQKACVVHSFREFMATEEIQDPPTVKTEMENMIKDQILLNERRLELLQHLGELLPPTHTKAETDEWYRSLVDLNRSIDTHNVQCMMKIRTQYEAVQQKCLAEVQLCKDNLSKLDAHIKKEAEEIVNSEFLQLTEKLQSQFEELEHMGRDFEELAEQNERNCGDLYSYFQEAMGLWDTHQLKLSQQEGELQKKLDECRWKQDNLIEGMETHLSVILEKMRKASSEEDLEKHLKNALSYLDKIRDRYETFNQDLMDEVMVYPEAILRKLISYSMSISQFFNVKEIFKQNLQGEIDFTSQDQELVEASEAESLVEQQAESIVEENEGKEKTDSCQQENEDTNTAENEEIFAQETEETEEKEDGESIPHESEETEHAEQGAMFSGSKVESSKIPVETFSTSSGNTYTVLGVEEAGKTDIPETYLTKYEKKESLPIYLRHVLTEETMFVELKKRIRLCFFEHLEKWFAESLSNSFVFVAAKKEELNSRLQLLLQFLQQRRENIETNTYNVRAAELSLHKEHLESHCAEVAEALKKENAEFRKFRHQQKNIGKNLHSRICDIESMFLSAPMTGKLVSLGNNLHSELHNHLEEMQVSLSSYRNYLEEALGKLRNSNEDFHKACRLFSEGGNFSPQELRSFSKRLQEERKQIKSFENSVKKDMEKMESKDLGEATELINQSETKLSYLFMSRVFMDKIQRLLRHLRVQIKSEVAKSNLQAATLNSHLEKLHQKIDACAHPAAVKEASTAEDVYEFAKVVLKELKERSQYLDCLLVKATSQHDKEDFTPLARGVTLQGPIAVAIRAECLRDKNKVTLTGLDPEKYPLLNPSRMGKSALDDLSISTIKNLLEARKRTKPILSDERFQIFGLMPPESG